MSTLAGLAQAGQKFTYEYDFGASWLRTITVKQELPPEPGDRPPLCLAGKGAGPMQEDGLDLGDLNATLAVLAMQRAR